MGDRLWELALAMEMKGERFRSSSYLKAARSIESLAEPIRSIRERGGLRKIEGVGESIATKVDEFLASGRMVAHEEVRDLLPEDLSLFRDSPLGLARVARLVKDWDLTSVDTLLKAIYEGLLATVPEMGEEVERRTHEWLTWRRGEAAEVPTPYAIRSAERIIRHLRGKGGVHEIVFTGPARRKVAAVANITILFAAERPDLVIAQFGTCPEVTELTMVERGFAVGRTACGVGCMIREVRMDEIVWEMFRRTGPEEHVRYVQARMEEMGVTAIEGGRSALQQEEEVYSLAGMEYHPPEMREGRGSRKGAVIGGKDLKGDLHVRSISFDGSIRVREQAEAAVRAGHAYICLCDRPVDRRGGEELFARRNDVIDEVNDRGKVIMMKGAEVDIMPDGRLSARSSLLDTMDLVIASVNTKLGMDRDEMTRRVLKAMDDPCMDVLGHPTGRVIGLRDRTAVDLRPVFEKAAEKKVALEMNAHPDRQDLDDNDAYRFYEAGAYYSLGTENSFPLSAEGWDWAVTMVRKAQIERGRLLNSRPAHELCGRAWRS